MIPAYHYYQVSLRVIQCVHSTQSFQPSVNPFRRHVGLEVDRDAITPPSAVQCDICRRGAQLLWSSCARRGPPPLCRSSLACSAGRECRRRRPLGRQQDVQPSCWLWVSKRDCLWIYASCLVLYLRRALIFACWCVNSAAQGVRGVHSSSAGLHSRAGLILPRPRTARPRLLASPKGRADSSVDVCALL
eukprot:COSAG02_NODE_285_length_25646_cov_10.858143_5_plen_189_part_00